MKSKTLIFIVLCFLSMQLFSQNQKILDSLEAALSTQVDSLKMNTYGSLIKGYARSNPEKAQQFIEDEFLFAEIHAREDYIALANMDAGNCYAMQASYPKAETYFVAAKKTFERIKDSAGIAEVNNNLSRVLFFKGDLEGSLMAGIAAARMNERSGADRSLLIGNYMTIGNTMSSLGNFTTSLEYYTKAEKIAISMNKPLRWAQVRHNLGENMKWLKRYEDAISYFTKNIAYYTETDNQYKLANTYNSLGTVYFEMEAYDTALPLIEKSYAITQKLGDKNGMAFNARNLGRLSMVKNDPRKALKFYTIGMNLSKETGSTAILRADYENVSNAYVGLGDYKNAYDYRLRHQTLNDSIFKAENVAKLNELDIQYQTAKKEASIALQEEEIKTLNAQAKSDRLSKTMYGIGMFSFVTIAGLLYFGFKQRMKKNEIERQKQEEVYKQEIAFKKKELTSQTLHLVQKNTFIQELRENLERIKKSPELFKVEFRRIVLLLKKENAEDKDWEVFKSYFSEVHNNFDEELRSIYQEISEKEIRLAAFLRMNLSTKEIASIFNVLPDSVLKSKYRLKKKLGVDKDMDLTTFLSTI
jgi:tetratricopeptide (TPR) repeat protein